MWFAVCGLLCKGCFLREGVGINHRPNLLTSPHFFPLMPTPMRYAHTYTHAHVRAMSIFLPRYQSVTYLVKLFLGKNLHI